MLRKEKIAYFRLHGFGRPSMYNYRFSGKELERLAITFEELSNPLSQIYVLSDNITCNEDAIRFGAMVL